MGRGIECIFIDYVIRELHKRGKKLISAEFTPTKKNVPAKNFLSDHGFAKLKTTKEKAGYGLNIPAYIKKPCRKTNKSIKIG